MQLKIGAELPFRWCADCMQRSLTTEKLIAEGAVIEMRTGCEHERICEAAERARRKTESEDRQRRQDWRYPWCENFQGCPECKDDNRGSWSCCPVVPPEEWSAPKKAMGYRCAFCQKLRATKQYGTLKTGVTYLKCPVSGKITLAKMNKEKSDERD